MTDDEIRSRFAVLDRTASPDHAFSQRLEEQLVHAVVSRTPPARRLLVVAAAFVLTLLVIGVAGLLGDESERVVLEAPEAPPTTVEGSATAETVTGDTTAIVSSGPTRGHLPDGTAFGVMAFEGSLTEAVQGISAAIVADLGDGSSPAIGIVRFSSPAVEERSTVDSRIVIPTGDWTVTIDLYPEVADHLGGAETVAGLIEPIQTSPSPRLVLTPPLRWADDAEVPLQMLVQYETFAVLRGCGPDAVACNLTRAVQVVPLDRLVAPSPEWSGTKMWIESSAARPPDDPYHLDPGPLEPRGGQTVLWTGGEMLVWGGATSDAPATRIDGAAFDPDTGVWRPIAEPPLEGLQPNAAVWTGDVMVVIARDATLTYDPDADSWETIGEGLLAGQAIWVDDRPFVWNATGVFGFDDGTWTPLPDPGFGSAETWQGTLLNLDGSLLASGLANGLRCQPRRMAVWDGSSWRDLPSFSLATPALADCSLANQSAVVGDDVLVWESNDHPTLRYDPADGAWNEVARIPNPSTEGPAGPVALDGRVLVPFNGSGAIFDARDDTWTPVALPGGGDATDMVWTGDELLMWGATCCYGAGDAPFSIDAWRWEPPG